MTDRILAAGLHVDADAAREALSPEGSFNAIDPETGWKVDFIIRKSREFSVSEFERRRERQALGMELPLVSLEDLIVAKLEWAEKCGSETQLRDVRALLRSAPHDLDRAYLERWIRELDLTGVWNVVQRESST